MQAQPLTEQDTQKALQLWREYQALHDLSDRKGQVAGIDPESGRVWFGASALDIVRQLEAEAQRKPLYFIRVGYNHYLRKGRRA